MIDLYTWTTPNGRKVSILLEELGVPYRAHAVDITKGEQFAPDFLKIAPNNRIPAIVDHDSGIAMFESGAILIHLAEKAGRFLPAGGAERASVLQWLMWQMGGFGPMLGQAHYFLHYNPGLSEVAEKRFAEETRRLYRVLDTRLGQSAHVAGDDYTIADMAIWPWTARFAFHRVDLAEFPNVRRWYRSVGQRPAVQRGYQAPVPAGPVPGLD